MRLFPLKSFVCHCIRFALPFVCVCMRSLRKMISQRIFFSPRTFFFLPFLRCFFLFCLYGTFARKLFTILFRFNYIWLYVFFISSVIFRYKSLKSLLAYLFHAMTESLTLQFISKHNKRTYVLYTLFLILHHLFTLFTNGNRNSSGWKKIIFPHFHFCKHFFLLFSRFATIFLLQICVYFISGIHISSNLHQLSCS